MADNITVPDKKTVSLIKFMKFGLTTSVGEDDFGRLEWSIREGFPRITVYTTNKKGEDGRIGYEAIITAPFDFVTFFSFFKKIRKVIISDGKAECKIDCLNYRYDANNERTNEKYVQATVGVFKDDHGKIFIYVHATDKSQLTFEIRPRPFFNHYDEEGNLVKDIRVINKEYALSYISVIEKLMAEHVKNEHVREIKLDPPQGRQKQTPVIKPVEQPAPKPAPVKPTIEITEGIDLDNLI